MTSTHPQLTRAEIILQLDQEVDRLLQARHLLSGILPSPQDSAVAAMDSILKTTKLSLMPSSEEIKRRGEIDHFKPAARRQVSPAGRRRMARAQRLRWKKFKQAAQRAEKKSA